MLIAGPLAEFECDARRTSGVVKEEAQTVDGLLRLRFGNHAEVKHELHVEEGREPLQERTKLCLLLVVEHLLLLPVIGSVADGARKPHSPSAVSRSRGVEALYTPDRVGFDVVKHLESEGVSDLGLAFDKAVHDCGGQACL